MHDEIAALRRELTETTNKLFERVARLPTVKNWTDTVHYLGDVVVDDDGGGVYQAKRDTGRPVTSDDWICLARRGRDGRDGRAPAFRGGFRADETYHAFDAVELDGTSFVATCSYPGIPGIDGGWKILAKRGVQGPQGERGERGRKGERGRPGAAAPQVVTWTPDLKNYRLVPTMSDGTAGPAADVRPLLEQFCLEAISPLVDDAINAALKNATRPMWSL